MFMQIRTRAVLNYFLRRLGPLTTTGCDHGAFISTLGERLTLLHQACLKRHCKRLKAALASDCAGPPQAVSKPDLAADSSCPGMRAGEQSGPYESDADLADQL